MVLSMTGFGRARCESNLFLVTVELKSVNHRFAEINIRMPRQLLVIEDKIKKMLTDYIRRGRLEVFITVEGEGLISRSIQVDWPLIDEVYHMLKKAKEKYSLQDEITLTQLFKHDDAFSIIEKESDNADLESLIFNTVRLAAEQLKQMREMEGKELKAAITTYLNEINTITDVINDHAPLVVNQYRQKLLKKMSEFMDGVIDENRILTEVAIFADKSDISEEIIRIKSHLSQFTETLEQHGSIGRKLDFLIQELNREMNTIGSKANDGFIAQKVVELKSELEKIREQVQNIE